MNNLDVKKFSGYSQVILASAITFAVGMSYGAYGLLIVPLSDRLGCSLAAAGIPAIFENIAGFLSGLFISGKMIEKFTARRCMIINALITSIFLISYVYTPSLFLLCFWEAVTGASMAFGFTNALSAFIRKWFIDRRETVLGVALASNGLGAAAGVWLFGFISTSFSTAAACIVFFAISIGVVVIGIFFIRNPEQLSQHPLGWNNSTQGTSDTNIDGSEDFGVDFHTALHSPSLYLIMASCLLCSFSMMLSPYLATVLMSNGMGEMNAANFATINNLALALASVVVGTITAKLGTKFYVIVSFGLATLGLAALGGWIGFSTNSLLLVVAAIGLGTGFSVGNTYGPLVTTKIFGNRCYDRIIPMIFSMRGIGLALGVIIIPTTAGKLGSWIPSIVAGAGIMIVATAMSLLAIRLAPMNKDQVQ